MAIFTLQLQPVEQILFKDGWVASDFAISPNMASKLFNLRVEVDGLHLVEGWQNTAHIDVGSMLIKPLNVEVVSSPLGRRWAMFWTHGGSGAIIWVLGDPEAQPVLISPGTGGILTPDWLLPPPVTTVGPYVYAISSAPFYNPPIAETSLYRWEFPDVVWRRAPGTPVGRFAPVYASEGDPPIPYAACLGSLGYRLIAANIFEYDWDSNENKWVRIGHYPNRIQWSGLDQPAFWDVTAYFDLFEHEEITRLLPLADALVVYTNNDVYVLQQTGDVVAPFAISKVLSNPGILHPSAVLDVSSQEFKGHILITWTGVWVFTGGETQLLSANIRNIWKKFVEAGQYIRPYYDPVNEEIIIANHKEERAVVFQLRWRTWYERDFALDGWGYVTYPLDPANRDFSLVSRCVGAKVTPLENGNRVLFFKIDGVLRDNQPAEAELITPIQEFVPPSQQAILHAGTAYWTAEAAAPGKMTYTVEAANHWNDIAANQPTVQSHQLEAPVGASMPLVTMYLRGRAFRWKMKFTGLTKPLKLHGHVAYFRPPVGR